MGVVREQTPPRTLRMGLHNNSMAVILRLTRPLTRRHFRSFVSEGDLVFDVGANVGDLTHIFSALGAHVVSIEPQPECVKILQKRFRRRPDVTILEMGASDLPGELPLYAAGDFHTTSTFSERYMTKGRFSGRFSRKHRVSRRTVRVTTLDELIAQYGIPAFCKIDVEGFELKVLKGLSHRIPALSFEFQADRLPEAQRCVHQLTSLGSVRFNYSPLFFYNLVERTWLPGTEIVRRISCFSRLIPSGDIYARFE